MHGHREPHAWGERLSPTQRSLDRLRKTGALAAVVEKWNSHAHIRQDLFGFIDLVALDEGTGVLGVQTTTGDHVAERVRKVTEDETLSARARMWLGKGNRVEFHGWRKIGNRWACRVLDLVLQVDENGPALQAIERQAEAPAAVRLSRSKTSGARRRSTRKSSQTLAA